MADEAIPVAKEIYSQIENKTGAVFFHALPLLEIFDSVKTKNDWQFRVAENNLSAYVEKFLSHNEIPPSINAPFGAIQLKETFRLDATDFLSATRNYFADLNLLASEKFSFDDVTISGSSVTWKNIKADKIIFCEGFLAANNPYFQNLPYQFSKGQIITITCKELSQTHIINQGIFILPLGQHTFKVGSTYEWSTLDNVPTPLAKSELITKLKKIISAPFQIVTHQAAIRPTVKNRRPFIGLHPVHNTVGIFNGFGTKAVMLAPYFAKQFAEYLIDGKKLNPEVDISLLPFHK